MNDLNQELDLLSPIELVNLPDSLHSDELVAPKKREKFVGFFLGAKLFCVPAEKVSEVAHPPAITSLPNSPQSLLGIAAVRGEVVAVVNIKKLLHEGISRSDGKSKLIVLQAEEKETRIGFPVDKMLEVVTIADDEIEPCGDRPQSYIVGSSVQEAGVFHLIGTDKLTGALELD